MKRKIDPDVWGTKNQKFMRTEDGVTLRPGMDYYAVFFRTNLISKVLAYEVKGPFTYNPTYNYSDEAVYFHDFENAKYYAEMNKPVFSKKQIAELMLIISLMN